MNLETKAKLFLGVLVDKYHETSEEFSIEKKDCFGIKEIFYCYINGEVAIRTEKLPGFSYRNKREEITNSLLGVEVQVGDEIYTSGVDFIDTLYFRRYVKRFIRQYRFAYWNIKFQKLKIFLMEAEMFIKS